MEANPSNTVGGSGYIGDNPLVIDAYVSHMTGREPAHVKFIRDLLTKRGISKDDAKAEGLTDKNKQATANGFDAFLLTVERILNANPAGCNQHTGSGCSIGGLSRTSAKDVQAARTGNRQATDKIVSQHQGMIHSELA